jgi:predicted RecB family nuclease
MCAVWQTTCWSWGFDVETEGEVMTAETNVKITKHTVSLARTCMRMGWESARRQEHHNIAALGIFRQGNLVEHEAMLLFPGKRIGSTGASAVRATSSALSTSESFLQQPAFEIAGIVIRPDVLETGCVHVLDVKSGKSVKHKYVLDIAISVAAAEASGLDVELASICHINPAYRGGGEEPAFVVKNVSSQVNTLLASFDVENTIHDLQSIEEPIPVMTKACKSCEFTENCFGTTSGLVVSIPRLSKRALDQFVAAGVFTIDQLLQRPGLHHLLTPTQYSHVEAHRIPANGQVVASVNMAVLEDCTWLKAPVHLHLDFEAVTLALPTRISDAPWAQSLTQFSVSTDDGENYAEVGFLSDGSDDREQLAHALIEALPGTAPIVVYNESYERKRIEELATLYPHLNESLKAILQRLVDLRPLANDAIVGLAGGSLKMVSPWADAEFSYDDLVISNGKLANAAMQLLMLEGGEAILKSSTGLSREEVRAELLSYCARDTMATAVVVRRFKQLLAGEGAPSTVEHGV